MRLAPGHRWRSRGRTSVNEASLSGLTWVRDAPPVASSPTFGSIGGTRNTTAGHGNIRVVVLPIDVARAADQERACPRANIFGDRGRGVPNRVDGHKQHLFVCVFVLSGFGAATTEEPGGFRHVDAPSQRMRLHSSPDLRLPSTGRTTSRLHVVLAS